MREAIVYSLLMLISILGIIGCYPLLVAKAKMKKKGQWYGYEDTEYQNHLGL